MNRNEEVMKHIEEETGMVQVTLLKFPSRCGDKEKKRKSSIHWDSAYSQALKLNPDEELIPKLHSNRYRCTKHCALTWLFSRYISHQIYCKDFWRGVQVFGPSKTIFLITKVTHHKSRARARESSRAHLKKLVERINLFQFLRSAVRLQINNLNGAKEDARKVIELKPEWSKGYERLGSALFKENKRSEARMQFQKAVELDAFNESAQEKLRKCDEPQQNYQPPPQQNYQPPPQQDQVKP